MQIFVTALLVVTVPALGVGDPRHGFPEDCGPCKGSNEEINLSAIAGEDVKLKDLTTDDEGSFLQVASASKENEDSVNAVVGILKEAKGVAKQVCSKFGLESDPDCAKLLADALAKDGANERDIAIGLLRGDFKHNFDMDQDLHMRLKELPASEPHHICMTGGYAVRSVRDWILPAGHELEEFKMPSKLAPENECSVWEHAAGHSLITVSSRLEDRCAARFKVHFLSCDVLVHAHEGEDCDDLYKLRLLADQPFASLIVLHSGKPLMECYRRMDATARSAGMSPLTPHEMEPAHLVSLQSGAGRDLRRAITVALGAAREHATKRYAAGAVGARANFGNASRVRDRLLDGSSTGVTNVMLEMLKHTQGYKADARALSLATEKGRLVVDMGSSTIKAGFDYDDAPRMVFPSIVGRPKNPDFMSWAMQDLFVGNEVGPMRGYLKVTYPINFGLVKNWEDFTNILNYVYNELSVEPEESAVLLTEPPLNPKVSRERMTQIMFETFHSPAMYVGVQAVLSLYRSGQTTGIVVDSGDGISYIVPIYEGYAIPQGIKKHPVAGQYLTTRLAKLLYERGYNFQSAEDLEVVRDIKEKLCYVAADFEEDLELARSGSTLAESYTLKDDKVITLNDERFRAAEALFNPSMVGLDAEGIDKMTFASIMSVDKDLHEDLFERILLSGGSTMFRGFAERMQKGISALAPFDVKVNVIAPPSRQYSCWIGGSILARSMLEEMWISKNEYDAGRP